LLLLMPLLQIPRTLLLRCSSSSASSSSYTQRSKARTFLRTAKQSMACKSFMGVFVDHILCAFNPSVCDILELVHTCTLVDPGGGVTRVSYRIVYHSDITTQVALQMK
jgi:hypothetical protein